jgi:hypothetical protein
MRFVCHTVREPHLPRAADHQYLQIAWPRGTRFSSALCSRHWSMKLSISLVIHPSGLLSSPAPTHSLACGFPEAGRETVDDACAQAMRTGIPNICI